MARRHRIEARARIPASPGRVYGILLDFREGHPAILPPEYFRNFTVESGGTGAGTVLQFEFHLGGSTRRIRSVVAEPEPGRRLTETDNQHDSVTSFQVDPADGGSASLVTIATEFPSRAGIGGVIQRWVTGRLLKRVYAGELTRLRRDAGERL